MNVFLVNPVSGIDDMLTTALKDIQRSASSVDNARTESEILEILGYVFNAVEPRDRIIRNPNRKNNLVAQIAETAWILSGSSEIKYISPFLPRAVDFSDDGKHWRAGYGPRIASLTYTPPEGFWVNKRDNFYVETKSKRTTVNQLENVIEILTTDPSSRQAYMIVPLPGDNLVSNQTADTPCTLAIQFIIREGKLHCFVDMRSNDIIWGTTGINFFEWTFLQEVLACILGVEIGVYTHKAGSLHIYEKHYTMADKILEPYDNMAWNEDNHLPVEVRDYNELKSVLTEYNAIFESIVYENGAGREELWNRIKNFYNWNSMCIYLSVPLVELLFKHFHFEDNELESKVKTLYSPYDNLYKGLLKAGKFFMKGKLNN